MYFNYAFTEALRESFGWKVENCVDKAQDDYRCLKEQDKNVYLNPAEKRIHFEGFVLPAYWYREEMPQEEIEENLLRYKRIWEKTGYGELAYPLLQDWHPLNLWREKYSEPLLAKMEADLKAGAGDEAMRLYYYYSRRAGIWEIDSVYPDKIKQIISISNRSGSGKEITADIHILLHNGQECSVRVGTDSQGRLRSKTARTTPGFPMFTDQDDELIQRALFDDNQTC